MKDSADFQRNKAALLDLVKMRQQTEKPELMVRVVDLTICHEAIRFLQEEIRILTEDNESLRKQLAEKLKDSAQ